MNLENDLGRVLQRRQPPDGFAARVLERTTELHVTRRTAWWRAAAASLLLAAFVGGYGAHRTIEHRKGERAKEQLLTAMHIAGEKVRYAQEQVNQIGSNRSEN